MVNKLGETRSQFLSAIGYTQIHPMDESVWRRGWNDTKAGWTHWRFLLMDVIGLPALGVFVDPRLVLPAAAASLILIWIGATATANPPKK